MKILIGGDYVPRENIASMMENKDFSYFDEIKEITSQADYSILNLEAPIVDVDASPIEKCGPNLKTTSSVVDSLKYTGFDMVTLANNHIMDYGESGLTQTINSLESGNIEYVGVGGNLEQAKRIKYIEINNKKLAIINCCEHEFSIATETKAGANPLNPISQYYAIMEAKAKADFVLVIVHGGHEHWQLPSPRMVKMYRYFIDLGADAVVNHHQHCYSGYEIYKDRPIFYGLGNLCFEYLSIKKNIWNYGYLVMLTLNNEVSFKIYPYSQCNGDSKVRLLNKNQFDLEIAKLNDVISNAEKLVSETNKYYLKNSKSMKLVFEPYQHRITNKLYLMGLLPSFIRGAKLQQIRNYINCESHRDKVIECLK